MLKWRKVWISDETYESAEVFDVNNDGVLDIVSGAFWYQGPDFRKKHFIAEVKAAGEYYDDFSTIPLDVNGDGNMDFVTGGWWGKSLRWMENPGKEKEKWTEHIIAETGSIETTRAWDIDRDGIPEIIPNCPGSKELAVYKLAAGMDGKGAGKFTKHTLFSFPGDMTQGHGLGCGDIAGNGRMDIVLRNGWLESPENPLTGEWLWHPDFDLGPASVPVIVADINSDGVSELISGMAHNYGLDWWSQKNSGGKRVWTKHPIDPFNAQYHDMKWLDIDGDGKPELLTGKRHRAHCGNDPGEWDDYGIYYFKWNGESFTKNVIDYGPVGRTKGLGIHFAAADLRGSGKIDIAAPGKDGLFVFFNEGEEKY